MDSRSIYNLFSNFGRSRMLLFCKIMEPSPNDVILDVGGYPQTWYGSGITAKEVQCLNIRPIDHTSDPTSSPKISARVGDGCNLACPDKFYEIVFSNSVIEHVGNSNDQARFAKELDRVGKKLWVQTPAKEFFIEPHFIAPFVHWFPKPLMKKLVRWISVRTFLDKTSLAVRYHGR